MALWGDARAGLEDLAEALAEDGRQARAAAPTTSPRSRSAWRRGATRPRRGSISDERPIHMARLCRELNQALPADASSSPMAALPAHWTGLLYDTKTAGRHFIPDRGFASIGYGLPGGIGAALAAPATPVVAITGDGGFNMMLGELETARRAGIGLTIVVVNNAASGYVKALQHAMFRGRYQSSDLVEMDYAAIARAMGCNGVRVEDPDQLARGAGNGPRRAHPPDGARRRRDPRPRPHAARRRQPHRRVKQGDRVAS